MRSTSDRIRHTILFEFGLVIIFSPVASMILDKDFVQIGGLAICLSIIAMGVNYSYNLAFDHVLLKLGRPLSPRPAKLRVVHAGLFEVSLVLISLPVIAFALDLSLWQAFLTDLGFSIFTLIYALIFNWAYDYFLPIPDSSPI